MLNQIVVKLNRDCNLRCTYCYYINDKTQDLGQTIQKKHLDLFLAKYYQYCLERNITGRVSFHGGEPMLMGRKFFESLLSKDCFISGQIKVSIQTNAVLIDDRWVTLFKKHNVTVGISLDGSKVVNDKHRIMSNGKGSYDRVIKGLKLIQDSGIKYGILTVLDPSVCGASVFNHLVSLGVSDIDFLPPISNHMAQLTEPLDLKGVENFLVSAFNAWVKHGDPEVTVRIFCELVWSYLNNSEGYSAIGMKNWGAFAVLETNGKFARNEEFIDIDRVDKRQRYYTDLHIETCNLDEVENAVKLDSLDMDWISTPSKCMSCPANDVCLGGNIVTRYDVNGSFNNPSIHCNSLYKLANMVKEHTSYLRANL